MTYNDTNVRRPCGSRLESAEDLQQIVLRVRRQCVPPGVNADARTPWDVVIETHVSCLRLIELHVPIAVGRYLLAELLSQADLSKSGAVGWERFCRERSCTCISNFPPDQFKRTMELYIICMRKKKLQDFIFINLAHKRNKNVLFKNINRKKLKK